MRIVVLLCLVAVALAGSWEATDVNADFESYMVNCYEYPNNIANEYQPNKLPVKGVQCDKLKAAATAVPAFKNLDDYIKKNKEMKSADASHKHAETEKKEAPAPQKVAPAAMVAGRGAAQKGGHGAAIQPAHAHVAAAAAFLELAERIHNPRAVGGHASVLWPAQTVAYCWNVGWNLMTKFVVWRGMQHLSSNTPVRFRKVDCNAAGHKIRFVFTAGSASSPVGYRGAAGVNSVAGSPHAAGASTQQDVKFDGSIGAFNSYSASHEITHSLGWDHTQSRHDRDSYVTVVEAGNANYRIEGPPDDLNYDYGSIMHYPQKNPAAGKPSLIPRAGGPAHGAPKPAGVPADMGQRRRLSANDAAMITAAYGHLPLQ